MAETYKKVNGKLQVTQTSITEQTEEQLQDKKDSLINELGIVNAKLTEIRK